MILKERADELIDLYLQCKIVTDAWISDRKNYEGSYIAMKEMAMELAQEGIEEAVLMNMISANLPTTLSHRFSVDTGG